MTSDEALTLQSRIDTILDQAKAEPDDVRVRMGAINWGDLGCVGIDLCLSVLNPGEQWHVARIEEAGPDAAGLKTYVRDKLGRPAGIVIETEW
jgi:hypothetical protein